MYANKTDTAKIFGISTPTVCRRIEGISKEVGKRYNQYAVLGNLVHLAVFADYQKYYKYLADKNLRKTVPPFDLQEAGKYLQEVKLKSVAY